MTLRPAIQGDLPQLQRDEGPGRCPGDLDIVPDSEGQFALWIRRRREGKVDSVLRCGRKALKKAQPSCQSP